MTLSTHAVAGGVIASTVSQLPVIGFILGFLSHFVLDAIPHWDYKPTSKIRSSSGPLDDDIILNRSFVVDLGKISLDFIIGLGIILVIRYLFRFPLEPLIIGGIAGILPDFLQFVYFKTRVEPFVSLQKFHVWIHSKKRVKSPFRGISAQVAIVLMFIAIAVS